MAPRPRRSATSSAEQDLLAAPIHATPRWLQRCVAWWAGRRDGRRGLNPDPETGVTPYLHMLCSINATMVESERLRTAAACAPIDAERARLVEIRERALRALVEEEEEWVEPLNPMARVRASRARRAVRMRRQQEIDSATETIAVLDERRADRVTVGALRIQRCTERAEQLLACYWRAFQRCHPEMAELRAGYRVPAVPIPAHPLGG